MEDRFSNLAIITHLSVTKEVRSLPAFNLPELRSVIAGIIDAESGGWNLDPERPVLFDLFGTSLAMAFDGDELVYDLGASDPSSPFGVVTVMLASEGAGR